MCGLLSKKLKFNFGTEKISLDEQYILGSDSGQLETRLWMHCLLRCNTWNNIAVKSRKDSELHDVTFVSEDGLLCPAPKVMLWSQNALPKFIFQNIALPKCPFHPLLHLIVGRKASLRPTSCQLDGEGSSLDESESELGLFHQWVKS